MLVLELEHFINEGFGWECKACRVANVAARESGLPRFYVEGEAEEKETRLTVPARARWRDAAQQSLYCPQCLAEEQVSKA